MLSLKPAIKCFQKLESLCYQSANKWGQDGNCMQSVSDNTAINYDKSLENLISGASHLKETSHFF